MIYKRQSLLYKNDLKSAADVADFVLEGSAQVSFNDAGMVLENVLDESLGQKSNFVFWCPHDFEGDIEISWKFRPIKEPGLAIMFFHALGLNGASIFSESLQKRTGEYDLYHSGDINAYHISYFRRKWDTERCFHTCNLRKSKGFHLVAQGADPIPDVDDCKEFYEIKIANKGSRVAFFIDDLLIFTYDDDASLGAVLKKGKIGFRQMAPLKAVYFDLQVYRI